MTTAPNNIPTRPNLRMADPRLPMTVSRAAIELDNASRGDGGSFEATRRFVRFLSEALPGNIEGNIRRPACIDANTVDVVGHTLNEFEGGGSVKTVEDVFQHAWKVVSEMEKASEAAKETDLNRLRRFCVVFGNNLLSYRASLRQDGPSNPHRR